MNLPQEPRRSSNSLERELEQIGLILARRRRDEPLRYFKPNAAQKRWIDEIAKPGAFIVINGGGNGSGKTYGLIAAIGAILTPLLASNAFSADIFQKFPYPKKCWIVSNPAELGDTSAIQTAIDELWPKNEYTAEKKGRQYNSIFRFKNGWVVELKSTEQAVQEFRGSTLGLIGLNEPLPEDIYRELLARTRRGGLIIGAMTSLDDEPWIVDGLLGRHDGKDYRIVYGGVEDNCKDHSEGGTLSHDQIEKILSKYPADEQEARRTGRPLSLSGRILKPFDRSVHVIPSIKPSEGAAVYQIIDPAAGKPMAIIYAMVDRAGNVTIFDEYPDYEFYGAKNPGLSLQDYKDIFSTKEVGFKVQERIIDRHFANTHHKPGDRTLKEQFGDMGIDFSDSYHVGENLPEVETGIQRIIDFLAYNKAKPIDATNRPRLYITENCKNTIVSLDRWSRNPKTLKPNDDGFKDFCDCVRYLVMANPEVDRPSNWPSVQKPYYRVNT